MVRFSVVSVDYCAYCVPESAVIRCVKKRRGMLNPAYPTCEALRLPLGRDKAVGQPTYDYTVKPSLPSPRRVSC